MVAVEPRIHGNVHQITHQRTGDDVSGVTNDGVSGVVDDGVCGVTGAGVSGVTGAGVSRASGDGVSGATGAGVSGVTGDSVGGVTGGGVCGVTGVGVSGVTGAGVSGVTGACVSGVTVDGPGSRVVGAAVASGAEGVGSGSLEPEEEPGSSRGPRWFQRGGPACYKSFWVGGNEHKGRAGLDDGWVRNCNHILVEGTCPCRCSCPFRKGCQEHKTAGERALTCLRTTLARYRSPGRDNAQD